MGQSPISFEDCLKRGQLAESLIARWLRARGCSVLPAYEVEVSRGKGPRLFGPTNELVLPDLLTFKCGRSCFVEAKCKTVFTWYRTGKCWNTGIDYRHWCDYLKVRAQVQVPVWLLFLHTSSVPDPIDATHSTGSCPSECPTGLFAQSTEVLDGKGRPGAGYAKGMIYWKDTDLKPLLTLAEFYEAIGET